eukprot:TRINITY_DN11581_c0_g1_i1.p1 TRINITY_DN11581_c0_g1~~TRINITY_DN11581_c0_g1_i1.p1  ORF type:complete len:422 (+),score=103.88 TRINITY_DN11581_c0_g1_i1:59-1324(+)
MENPSSGRPSSEEELIYTTFSYCPRCVMIEHKGLNLMPAKVVIDLDRVWLVVECPQHGYHRTLYCSDVPFFLRTLTFTYEKSQEIADVADVEDLKKKLQYSPKSTNLPLSLELPLWDAGEFVSDEVLTERVRYFKSLYPTNREFVVKMLGKLSLDMPGLNAKAKHVISLLPQSVLLFETSYERLVHLCHLPDSVFTHPHIYPALKYYLRRGDEEQCKQELIELFKHLKAFSGVQLMVTLCISRPYADLTQLLNFMRDQCGFIRLILISMERSPNDLLSSLLKKPLEPLPKKSFDDKLAQLSLSPTPPRPPSAKRSDRSDKKSTPPPPRLHPAARPPTAAHSPELSHVESADIYELLQHVQKCSFNSSSVGDFFPLSMAAALEPFLNMMGYGHYFIRPSPFCGFITCLVNSGKSFNSYPVTR